MDCIRYVIGEYTTSVGNAEVQPTTCIKKEMCTNNEMSSLDNASYIVSGYLNIEFRFKESNQRKIYAG